LALLQTGQLDGWKNPSSTERAQYFIIALGQGQA
jgi:hypothetical protein